MAQVSLMTVEITGRGRIRCPRCSEQTMIEACGILQWDNGSKTVVETSDNDLIHRCGRVLEWYCESCGSTEGYERGRGWNKQMSCVLCFAHMAQRLRR